MDGESAVASTADMGRAESDKSQRVIYMMHADLFLERALLQPAAAYEGAMVRH